MVVTYLAVCAAAGDFVATGFGVGCCAGGVTRGGGRGGVFV